MTSNPVCHELQLCYCNRNHFQFFNCQFITLLTFVFIHCLFSTESLFEFYTASHPLIQDRCPAAGFVQIFLFVVIKTYSSLFTGQRFAQSGHLVPQDLLAWFAVEFQYVKDLHVILPQFPIGQQLQVSYLVF